MMDAALSFRRRHGSALALFREFESRKTVVYIPAHSYVEQAVACVTHYKTEVQKLIDHPIRPETVPGVRLEMITINEKLISKILVSPLPDLKASDMIYFLIARSGNLTLVTEDRRLRNASLNGGVRALSIQSALAHVRGERPGGA
jgi:hypothetical protein